MVFKRHFFALLLLIVGTMVQLSAETTITYKADGKFVNNTTSGWVNSWTSTTTPSLTMSTTTSGGFNAANGYLAPKTFNMTVSSGYIITGYEITGRSQLTSGSTTITAGSSSKTFNANSSNDETFSVTGLDDKSTSFTISVSSGNKGNQNFRVTSIVITVEEDPFKPTVSEVYTINNTNNGRGALTYDPGKSTSHVWSSGKTGATAFDATNPNHQWVIVPTGTSGQYFLYNVGAGKFAIPTGIAQGEANPWIFSDNAVAVIFESQSDGSKKIKMATSPVSGTNAAYIAVSNEKTYPIINYNDAGGNFTITKVDGDQSTAANAAVAKLVKSQTALTTYPSTSGWYAIQIKSKTGSASYAGRYLQNSTSLYNNLYPLTFTGGVDVQPAITDPTYLTYINCTSWDVNTWQMPDGRYLVDNGSNKFPTPSATAGNVICGYDNGNYFKTNSNYYADPYNSNANYFIGETTSKRTSYTVYPIDIAAAGLTAWKVIVEGLDENTLVTCTRSDVSGMTSVYTNGYFFLPSNASDPAEGEFTVTIGSSTVTMNASVDTEGKTVTLSLPVLTIKSPMAEATFTWNGESKTGKSVTFVNTDNTISDPSITVSYTGNEYTSPELSQTTWDGTVSATVTCTLTPAFFSTNYGEKWVRIYSAKENSLVVELAQVSGGSKTNMRSRDFFSQKQLWCLVGDASSFTLYNKAAGEDYVLVSGSASPEQNTTITLQPSVSATNATWTLGDQFSSSDGPGYSIYLADASGSYGMHGWQSGNEVKYWGAGSGGSHFLIEDANSEVSLEMDGLDPTTMTVYTQNIAVLSSSVAGSASEKLITKDNFSTSSTAYVPVGTELTFGTPKMFMNYGFTGYNGSEQSKVVTATATPQTVTATFSVVRPDARYLWEPLRVYTGSGEKDYYRIPAIVTAKNGDVIAINDRRFNNDTDLGNNSGTAANPVNHHIDIIGVASSDNGATWSDEFMIMDGTGSGALAGYGDAAVVADRESNKVLVMACAGNVFYTGQNNSYHQSLQRTVLTHNGTTWVAETPTDVTDQFFAGSLVSSDGMFIGSGSLSQSKIIKKGDYYRIYCAVLERSNSNFVFYSDDFGLTWTMMGNTAAAKDNEPKVEELPDGSVLLSVRKSSGRTFNVWTWNDDTYATGSWGTAVASNNQTGGISFGNNSTNGDIRMIPAIKKSTGEVVTLAMQSVPTADGRAEVSLFYKELDPEVTYTPTTIAQNWSSRFLITPHSSAYSSFNSQPDGRIAFYMEEKPKAVTGYYMCYVPLTLDEITNNQYTGMAATFDVALNEVNNKSYATLYLPYDVTTSGSTKAYYIQTAENGSAQLTETNNEGTEIPANTAVVLVNDDADASVTLNATTGLEPLVSENANLLKGTLVPMALDLGSGTSFYALGKKNDKIGFYKFKSGTTTSITLGANKAYLETPAQASEARGFVFDFDGSSTGIDSMYDGQGTMYDGQGTMYDGQGTMYDGQGTMYDLSGRRVDSLKRGIYIVNGKKVIK